MANDAFISYATENKQIADAVCAKLEERGVRCWIAPRDILPGSNYASSIANAIDASRTMVLVFSSQANQSGHVKREAERAVHNGIPIVPFRIEDVEPSAELGYFLGGQHWLDAMTPPLEQHIFRLAEALKVLAGGQTPVPEPLADASKGGASLKPPTGHAAPSPPPKSPLLGNRTVIYSIIALVVIALLGGGLYASGLFTSSTTPSGSAISGSPTATPTAAPTTNPSTITQIVSSDASLSKFASLLNNANMTGVLDGKGNFTVFAPDNAAFSKVDASTLAAWQSYTPALRNVLWYHVVPTKILSNDFTGSGTLTTVNGRSVTYSVSGTQLKIGNATVTKADINAANGVVHKIDTVLVP